MIVCILWQHRLAVRHVCSQRGLFFAVEADGVLAITRKGEGWQVQLSETLQFLDSSRRCRLIKGRHDELCYLPFYEKLISTTISRMPVTINTRSINGPKAAGCSARKH